MTLLQGFSYELTATGRIDTEPLGYSALSLFFEDLTLITCRHLSTHTGFSKCTLHLYEPLAKTSREYAMGEKTQCKAVRQTAVFISRQYVNCIMTYVDVQRAIQFINCN